MDNEIFKAFDLPSCDINDPLLLDQLVRVILESDILVEDVPVFIEQSANPSNANELLNNLAIYFWQSQKLDYVIPLLNKSLVNKPNFPDAQFNMGYILHSIGEDGLALNYLNEIQHKTQEALDLIDEINKKMNVGPSFLKEYQVQMLQEPFMKYPVYAREGTSDLTVYRQIFLGRDYIFKLSFTPKLIIDGGANVGYGSVLFATVYPEAEIIAVEPESSNYEVLQYNTAPYGKITTKQTGLWNKDTFLKVRDIGLDKWGSIVEETVSTDPEAFQASTISSLLKDYPDQVIDILKLDIEGAEKELFTSNYDEWLGRVKVLIIELHDPMKRGCSKAFFKAISNYDFVTFVRGENLVLIKENIFFNNK
ncbi:FkbM family methyltransferase [Paenibacillus vini]|uniref:FkbM family methyltransferase n=1 Tax=Paenibacillus vini TaxID=1476024 RepID=UPI0025B7065F|nr:FkbM family methyltransferase [Paenibacillus vini]MDN4066470.1 FkbM family methyltransferase [Paenibacillus vini]